MDEYKELYLELKNDYEGAIDYIRKIEGRNVRLEKDMDILSNIIQISKYINSYIRNKNFTNMINDMIIGVLGVKHSNIYVRNSLGVLKNETRNSQICKIELSKKEKKCMEEGKEYLFTAEEEIKICPLCKGGVKSSMGIPIKLREKFIGYIAVEHTINLTEENRMFLKSISAQIAIALENSILYRELSNIAQKDSLMGIYNRKFFFERVEEIIKRERIKEFGIIMIDLDNFKMINDTFGHQYGDEVLKVISKVIVKNIFKKSIFARYGGEELIIFVYDYDNRSDIYDNIENMRKKIESTEIFLGNIKSKITISMGIAFSKVEDTLAKVINKADSNLYKAKREGKNRIVWR
ncbi:MAG: sensor domain-containing diguanylate cyclase [Clostridium sp.]